VIVTTRRAGFAVLGQVMEVDVMDLPSGVRLLRTRVPELPDGIGGEIAEELGQLPLALEQAAAYLDLSRMPAAEYLILLRQCAKDLYLEGQVSGRRDTIATLWDITLERVSGENPAAVALLDLCAYLAPEPIPLDLFTLHPELLPPALSAAAADGVAFNKVIAVLLDYSLAKRTETGLQLHRLVQGVIRARHTSAQRGPDRTVKLMTADTTDTGANQPTLGIVLGLLHADLPEQIADSPQNWPRWAVLLPHVLASVDRAANLPADVEETARTDTAWLLDHAANYLRVHARLAEARPLAERTVTIIEAAYGPNHPRVANDLNTVATILQDLGQPAQARPLAERALTIDQAAYGPDHPTIATDLNTLATILQDLGQPAQARLLAERALTITETIYGPAHPAVATIRGNLAMILRNFGPPAHRARGRPLRVRLLITAPENAALTCWSENREQIRQSESQWTVLTNYVLAIAAVISGLVVQQHFRLQTLPRPSWSC
jgi:tetratricopeptide (TPR) repeat protein